MTGLDPISDAAPSAGRLTRPLRLRASLRHRLETIHVTPTSKKAHGSNDEPPRRIMINLSQAELLTSGSVRENTCG